MGKLKLTDSLVVKIVVYSIKNDWTFKEISTKFNQTKNLTGKWVR